EYILFHIPVSPLKGPLSFTLYFST
ncbi:hypothetical protein VN97_g13291, partial [Penicillium thymicola]